MDTIKLNTKMQLWGMVEFENELGERDRREQKIKDLWVNASFSNTNTNMLGGTQIKSPTATQKIRVRKLEIKNPKLDMYFVDRDGFKYEILDFYPDYFNNDFWEFRTNMKKD